MQQSNSIVKAITFVVSGTYNNMVSRPYEANLTPQTLSAFVEQTRQGQLLNTQAVAGVAGRIIQPATQHQGVVSIANGWGEKRLMFLMEIELMNVGAKVTHYISGFTDHVGYIARDVNVFLAPEMRMVINNIITVRENSRIMPGMGAVAVPTVVDAAHFVRGNTSSNYSQGNFRYQGHISMRPEDLVGRIDEMHLSQANQNVQVFGTGSTFASGIKRSRLNNSSAGSYLSKTLTAIRSSVDAADNNYDHTQVMENARTNLTDGAVSTEEFFFRLQKRAEGFMQSGSFTWRELCQLQPDVDSKARVMESGPLRRSSSGAMMGVAGSTCGWEGGNRETIAATILNNAVPSLMSEFLLTGVGFSVKTGSMVPMPGATRVQLPNAIYDVLITKFMAFGGERIDMSGMIPRFIDRLVRELITDITSNNIMELELHGEFSLGMSENSINIKIGDGVMTPFNAPAFCDSLSLPILATSTQSLDSLAKDVNAMSDIISTAPMGNHHNVNTSNRFVL